MFEPFPIYDFKSGLQLDREPWLKPADAFSRLYDWYIQKGVLQKRHGHTPFSRIVHYGLDFEALGQTSRDWQGMTTAPNGNIYACAFGGDIYKQSGGIGDFVALGQTSRLWRGMAAASNGDIYACVYGGDIYKQSGDAGDFVALSQTSRDWQGMATAPNGNIYACDYGGDIYMRTSGAGDFIALGQSIRNWCGMTAAANGNIYASVYAGDIYMQTAGVGDFIALGQTSRLWRDLAAAANGNIYACVYSGDIYMQSGGAGNFEALGQTSRLWRGMAAGGGDVYACVANGDIYMQPAGPGYPVMGIFNHYKAKVETLLMMDTKRLNKYNTTLEQNEDLTRLQLPFKSGQTEILPDDVITGADSGDTATVVAVVLDNGTWAGGDTHGTLIIRDASEGDFADEDIKVSGAVVAHAKEAATYDEFTGDDADYFWYENWRDIGYMTNNNDQIHKFDGSYCTRFNIDLDVEGGPDNDVGTCLLIFQIKNRIVLLSTIERGNAYYQRARYSQIYSRGQAVVFRDDDYVDAPRDDIMTGADFIGDDLVVSFESGVMKFVYTGDPDAPFRWDRIESQEGFIAKMSLSAFSSEIIGVGKTRIIACDGREVYGIDDKIPDLMLNFNQKKVDYCYSMVTDEHRQTLTTYPDISSQYPDRVLVLNYEENQFAIFRMNIHVMGYSELQTTLSTDDMIGISLDDLDYSLDDKEITAGYPISLFGGRDGYIYRLFDGGSDNGAAISCLAEGSEWNPYNKEGRNAVLGWLDFLVDRNDNASFDVTCYLNTEKAPYKVETVECGEGEILKSLILKRVYCNAEGYFHRIELSNNAVGNRPRIHAIIPWFDRGGPTM